jgi:hypothetical protein|tara:strand:+ start:54 stop:245 length:192 start_codon:yes stop_codon:yes gene_type:complete
MLDTSILQTKTAGKLVNLLKLARTITKTGSNRCKRINDSIENVVGHHAKAVKKVESRLSQRRT